MKGAEKSQKAHGGLRYAPEPWVQRLPKRANGDVQMIMRAETFDDVFGKFNFEF